MPASKFNSPSLLGYFSPNSDSRSVDEARAAFAKIARRPLDLELSTPSRSAQFLLSPHDNVGSDPTGAVSVVLHGEVYIDVEDQAAHLARGFAEHGFDFVKNLHGSFALVVADKTRDQMAVITDRLNSRRIFASELEGGTCVSAHLASQPWNSFDLDTTGIAWYVTNRIVGNSRTLFNRVSVLARASIHEQAGKGFKSTPYWRYEFSPIRTRVDHRELIEELRIRLIRAVERRLYDSPTVFLSLSAGYDATGLLGILAYSLRAADVQCFSYDHGPVRQGSDADLSQQMATRAGYKHELVESYQGDFIAHIRNNALVGLNRSQSWYCAEEDAWRRLALRFAECPRPVVMVGDECLGWRRFALAGFSDVMASLQLHSLDVLECLLPLLPSDSLAKFEHGLHEDFEHLHALALEHKAGDWHNAKDWLYLDQRLGNVILPWRESFVSEAAQVRSPLLDNDILDFMMTVPTRWRLNKRLYRKTVTSMYPQLFDVPRSSTAGNYYLNLQREFTANADQVRQLIGTRASRLDDLIPPDVLRRLLDDVLNGKGPVVSSVRHANSIPRIMRQTLSRSLRRFAPARPPVIPAESANILLRLLVLRTALTSGE